MGLYHSKYFIFLSWLCLEFYSLYFTFICFDNNSITCINLLGFFWLTWIYMLISYSFHCLWAPNNSLFIYKIHKYSHEHKLCSHILLPLFSQFELHLHICYTSWYFPFWSLICSAIYFCFIISFLLSILIS